MALIIFLTSLIKECIAIWRQENEVDDSSREKLSRMIKSAFIVLAVIAYTAIVFKSYVLSKTLIDYKAAHPPVSQACLEKLHPDASSDSGTGLIVRDAWASKSPVLNSKYTDKELSYYDDTAR